MIPTVNYTGRDFQTAQASLSAFIQQTAPEDWSDFYESNLGMVLVGMFAYLVDNLSFGQDLSANEVFLATARRQDSGIRYGRSVGYVPAASSAAEVTVKSTSLPAQIAAAGALVSKGQSITGLNGLPYELLEDVEIAATDTVSRLSLRQGASFSETFGPTNQRNQEVVTSEVPVEQGSWHVFVGSLADPDNEWRQVENVRLEESATWTYNAWVDAEGRLHVRFGDGTAGAVPSSTITLQYRTTSGTAGNAPRNAVQGSVQATLLGPGGGVVSIEYRNDESAASGGRNAETIAEMRDNIPAYVQANGRAITLADYDNLVLQVPGVSLAFADLLTASFSGNVVKVHVWSDEDVTFTSESAQTSDTASTNYTRFMELPEDRTDDVQQFLLARTPIVTHTLVVRPTLAWVDIYLGNVVYNATYDKDTVRQLITDAVVGLFQDSTGFAIRISDLFRAIDAVQGVDHFYIERILVEWPKEVAATGTIVFTGDVNPTDGEVVVIGDGAVVKTFEFTPTGAPSDPDYIGVPIAAGNSTLTMINLVRRIIVYLDMQAVLDETASDPTALLTSDARGSRGNVTITTTGAAIAVTGMAGGSDSPVTHGDDYRRVQDPAAVGASDPWVPGPYCPNAPWADSSVSLGYNYDPVDGETVTVNDGVLTKIFEFRQTGSATPPNIQVNVAVGDQATTLANLRTAIWGAGLEIASATVVMSPGPSVRLVANDGFTLTVTTSNTTGGIVTRDDAWVDGGQVPYRPLQDIIIESAKSRARYYDYTYRYNYEIRYDSGVGTLYTSVVAINLRRLVFDLVTQ